ncbi:MAG: phosphotriesterase family protein [Lawsonibacter sp.]|jgi:predicted metal-dependent phosphotriesterase family hydrolase
MPVIRTILGDILPEEFGVCDAHEHLIRSSGPELDLNPWYDMSDVEAACEELDSYLAAGGKSMVLMDPLGCGRDVPSMLQIAERFRGRAHLVMATGFHKGSLYDNRSHWSLLYSHGDLVDLLVREVTEGMDRYSYAGPIVERTSAKAGVIKAGTSMQAITPFEQNALWLAADVQKECGACISTHTEMGTMGLETLQFLKEHGANLEKVVLCHTNKMRDVYYYQRLLDMGACLAFEGADRPQWGSEQELANSILWLVERGYQKQILLSMDAGRNVWQAYYMKKRGYIAKGISYLLTDFVPLLETVGISKDAINDMLVKNPARVLAIST